MKEIPKQDILKALVGVNPKHKEANADPGYFLWYLPKTDYCKHISYRSILNALSSTMLRFGASHHARVNIFKLHGLAKDGFRAFLRAYATHSAATRHIFSVKNLHLGHVTKSFALRETPTQLVNYGKTKTLTSPGFL